MEFLWFLWLVLIVVISYLLINPQQLRFNSHFIVDDYQQKTSTNQTDHYMLFASDGSEKTEKASHKKIEDAKKKGQVPKSSDVNNFITLIAAFVLVLAFGETLVKQIKQLLIYFLSNSYKTELISSSLPSLFMDSLNFYISVILLIMIPMMVAGIIANLIQTGFIFTGEGLKPSLEKINPLKGLKNMFGRKKLFDFIKNMMKLIVVTFISYLFVKGRYVDLLKLPYMGIYHSLGVLADLTKGLITQIAVLIGIIAVIDYAFQRFEFFRDLRMTKQEVKEEYKQMEGDPYIKGKRRQKQREIAMGGMRKAVSEATVIVTNPTHFAVAIKYEHDLDMVPKVVAKGLDFKAQKIKEIAKEHDIPVIENKPLARSLYKTVEVDDSIPMDLYKAVAEILVIVYRLKNKK